MSDLLNDAKHCVEANSSGSYANRILKELITIFECMQDDMQIISKQVVALKKRNAKLKKDNETLKQALKNHGEEAAKMLLK